MELLNDTLFPAGLFRTVIDEHRIAASLLARVTYDIQDCSLVPSLDQTWKVSGPPWESEYGPMDSDELFYKWGVDLFVFGHARAPGEHKATEVVVTLKVGGFRRSAIVFGDRVWQSGENGLVPGPPKPFKAIPLTMANAFGGKDKWDGLDVPFGDNPDGKGFYIEKGHAEGNPMPNIEDPENLISQWDQQPEPVGFTPCAVQCGLRLRNAIDVDDTGLLKSVRPTFFNAAHPRMILERLSPGDEVELSGVTVDEPLIFQIPKTELTVRLEFDAEVIERPLLIDQLGIEVDMRRAFIAYRYPFRYVLYPLQRRRCELSLKNSDAGFVGGAPQ